MFIYFRIPSTGTSLSLFFSPVFILFSFPFSFFLFSVYVSTFFLPFSFLHFFVLLSLTAFLSLFHYSLFPFFNPSSLPFNLIPCLPPLFFPSFLFFLPSILSFVPPLTNANEVCPFYSYKSRLWVGRPRNRGSIPGRSKRFVFSPQGPDRGWGPLNVLLPNGYLGLFPRL
jgi:hypothetical protein